MSVIGPDRDGAGDAAVDVFVSYARADLAFVDKLVAGLDAHGIRPAIDRTEIYAFEDWWKRIEALIAAADTIVFVLSPHSVASDICCKEVERALALKKRIAPIVCRSVADDMDKIPPALSQLNFITFDSAGSFDQALDKLVEALRTDIGWIRRHTAFGLDATSWAAAGRPRGLLLRAPRLEEAEHWVAARPAGAPALTAETQSFLLRSRREATRRRNVLVGSLAAGLVIAIGLAGLAFWQRQRAAEQTRIAVAQKKVAVLQEQLAKSATKRAEQSLATAKTTVDGLIYDIAQGLRDAKGMKIDTVRHVLETAQHAMDQLLVTAPDDEQLLRSRGNMLRLFAQTYDSAGDLHQAAREANLAVEAHKKLFERFRSFKASNDLATSLLTLAGIEAQTSQADAAVQHMSQGVTIARILVASAPKGDAEMSALLSSGLESLGSLQLRLGHSDQASASFREGLGYRRVQAVQNPDDWAKQSALMISLDKVGDLTIKSGELPAAMAYYQEAIEIAHNVVRKNPENKDYAALLASALQRSGNAYTRASDLSKAKAAFEESVAVYQGLVAQDPKDVRQQDGMSISLVRLGDVELDSGDRANALKHYASALDIDRKVSAIDPENVAFKVTVENALSRVGKLEVQANSTERGLTDLQEAVDLARTIATQSPRDVNLRRELASRLTDLGDAKRQPEDAEADLGLYQEAFTILSAIATSNAGDMSAQDDLSVILQRTAMAKLRVGDTSGATEDFRQQLRIARMVARNDPDNIEKQWGLVKSLCQAAPTLDDQAVVNEANEIADRLEAGGKLSAPRKAFAERLKAIVARYR